MQNITQKQTSNYKWHAVYTRSRTEKKAYGELVQKGIESYLPLKVVRKQWAKQYRIVEEPLIRGYIFVRVSNREFIEVLHTTGVLWYVCFEGKPAVIADQQMESLKAFMGIEKNDVEVTSEQIKKGDIVRIISGPLKGLCAEIVDVRGKYRILLRFDNLGCCIHVEVGTNKVEAVLQNCHVV